MHLLALLSMLPLAAPADGAAPVPEWVHLVPAGSSRGIDGRGPWTLEDPQAVILASAQYLPAVLDENHSTDLAAPVGNPAPARGWIRELQARDDGIWGRVEWTPEGNALLAAKAYRGISPAIGYDQATGRILNVRRASLTNNPNLRQLTALNHQEPDSMKLLEQLRALHGLPAEADEAAVVTACTAARTAANGIATALNSIATAAGLSPGQDASALATALAAQRAAAGNAGDLAKEVVALNARITDLVNGAAKKDATTAIDAAMKAGKPITLGVRQHYIDRYATDPVGVQRELDALPALNAGGILVPPKVDGQPDALDADEQKLVALLGVDPAKYAEEKKRLGETVEAA